MGGTFMKKPSLGRRFSVLLTRDTPGERLQSYIAPLRGTTRRLAIPRH